MNGQNVVVLDPGVAGGNVRVHVEKMIALANKNQGFVKSNFNGVELEARPGMSADFLLGFYHGAMSKTCKDFKDGG